MWLDIEMSLDIQNAGINVMSSCHDGFGDRFLSTMYTNYVIIALFTILRIILACNIK